MDRIRSGIRLLALFSVFFVYKAITGATFNEVVIWSLITLVYIISLVIMYFISTRWKKEQKI
ncbi:MAG: hypothetical protein KGD65_06615 [Candidatus Lokiarchaeota archaeon]|nr:hypothetical protein [Candidatus Lokiarchaeota archaeon]